MLVLSRKKSEQIVIQVPAGPAREIVVTTVEIGVNKVRSGFEADPEVTIHRREVQEAIERERMEADGPRPTEAA